MKLGLLLSYAGQKVNLPMDHILELEEMGFDSVWIAETWGADAVSIASWILSRTTKIKVGTAIMQLPARSPANCAQTCLALQQLSQGRFMCGLGNSGPQVVEGWHGAGYGKALTRMREYIDIMRQVMRRDKISFDGEIYTLPYKGENSMGLGKSLKTILGADESIPIYTASFTPGGLRQAGEIADGTIPVFLSPEKVHLIQEHVDEGLAKAGRSKDDFDIAPFTYVVMGDDLDACRQPIRDLVALYVGGMGAKSKNFYNDYAKRLGYPDEAEKIQDLYLSGKKAEAAAQVPDSLVDEIAMVGDADRIREQAQKWKALEKDGFVKTMICTVSSPEAAKVLIDVFK